MKKRPPVQLHQRVSMPVHDLGHTGEGIGRIDSYTVFVPGGLIGDTVTVQLTQVGPRFGRGRIVTLETPSPDRIAPPCPIADRCGGCQIQALDYSAQLRWKTDRVQSLITQANLTNAAPVSPIQANPTPWRYRNKAVIPVSTDSNGKAIAGFFAPQSHQIVPMTDCLIQPTVVADSMKLICDLIDRHQISVYNETHHHGLIRGVLIRTAGNQVGVALIINGTQLPHVDEWIRTLQQLPGITGFGIIINTQSTNVPVTPNAISLWGSLDLDYPLNRLRLRAPIYGFFQVNTVQAAAMVRQVQAWIGHQPDAVVYDLYCGVGSFGLAIAPQVGQVLACELTPESKAFSRHNAHHNQIDNIHFETGDAAAVTAQWTAQGHHPTVVIIDPPRKGCDPNMIQLLLKLAPQQVIYVSCDPATLCRDLAALDSLYQVQAIQPIDLFSHTAHVETMVLATRR